MLLINLIFLATGFLIISIFYANSNWKYNYVTEFKKTWLPRTQQQDTLFSITQ